VLRKMVSIIYLASKATAEFNAEPMKDFSEDEYEEDYTPEVEISKEKSDAARKARAEREEKLRQMMEDDNSIAADDVSMDDAPVETEEEPTSAPLDKQPQSREMDEPEAAVTVTGGRRRGRRRVTKKKTVKDEEGYLGNYLLSCVNFFFSSLTMNSDQRRTSLGVFFGRRA